MTRKQIAFDLDTRALSPSTPKGLCPSQRSLRSQCSPQPGLPPAVPKRATLDPDPGLCPEPHTRREAEGQGASLSLAGKCDASLHQGVRVVFSPFGRKSPPASLPP